MKWTCGTWPLISQNLTKFGDRVDLSKYIENRIISKRINKTNQRGWWRLTIVVSDRDDRGDAVWRRVHHTESRRGVSQNLQPHGGNGPLRSKADSRRKYMYNIHLLISLSKFQFIFTLIFFASNKKLCFYKLSWIIHKYIYFAFFFRKRKDMHWTQKWPMMQNR